MPTTVASLNDLNKLLAADQANLAVDAAQSADIADLRSIIQSIAATLNDLDARLDKLEAAPAPDPEPTPDPVPEPTPDPTPVPEIPPVPSGLTVVQLSANRRGRTGGFPKIIRSPAELGKLVLPFDHSITLRPQAVAAGNYTPGAFSQVGLAADMQGSGERPDIGVVTNAIAFWLSGGSPEVMLKQAEAHGSIPVHFVYDGKVVDAIKYPNANANSPEKGSPFFSASGGGIVVDRAHYPALTYVPFLATGDEYYLEELQFSATYAIICAPPDYRGKGKPILNDIQLRGLAWGLREVASAYIATPESVSGVLLPKSYWKQIVDNIREYFEQRISGTRGATYGGNGSSVLERVIHQFHSNGNNAGEFSPWQADYLYQVIGWMVYTGQFPEWKPIETWLAEGVINRFTGALRSQGCQRWLKPNGSDWPSLLASNGLGNPTSDGNFPQWVVSDSPAYAALARMSLATAKLNGHNASEQFDYVNGQVKRIGFLSDRHAVIG